MTAHEVLELIRKRGASVAVEGTKLKLRAPEPLPAELMELAREHKPELLALLLETRLVTQGISIAIHNESGEASLIFSESDANTARKVSNVCKPFEIRLTDAQRNQLIRDLDYYEGILRRRQRKLQDED